MTSRSQNNTADVIVVGGGLAGLSAVHQLKKHDPTLKVILLEAKDRLGGRTLTVPLKTANGEDSWDLGGQWVSGSHRNVLDLLEEFNMETFPQYVTGWKLFQLNDEEIVRFRGLLPPVSLPVLVDFGLFLRRMRKLTRSLPTSDPYSFPEAEALDSITVSAYYKKQFWTEMAGHLSNMCLETITGYNLRHQSVLHLLMLTASAGGLRQLYCAQDMRVKGGTQQISHRLAESADLVFMNHPVTSVQHVDGMVHLQTLDGDTFICQKAIMAIPFHLNDKMEYSPPLLPHHKYLCRQMHVGNLVKVVAVYEKAFWREKGFSGEVCSDGLHKSKDLAPIDIVHDATSANGNAALVGFLSAERSHYWSAKEPEVRKEAVLRCLAQYFGEEALSPVSYIEKDWYLEPYNGGCPLAICSPGVMHLYVYTRIPHESVYFAGTETATEWIGYMEGAISSGRRAALQILSKIRPDVLSGEELDEIKKYQVVCSAKGHKLPRKRGVFRYGLVLLTVAIAAIVVKKINIVLLF